MTATEPPPIVKARCAACKREAPDPGSDAAKLWCEDRELDALLCPSCFHDLEAQAKVRVERQCAAEGKLSEDEAVEAGDEAEENRLWLAKLRAMREERRRAESESG